MLFDIFENCVSTWSLTTFATITYNYSQYFVHMQIAHLAPNSD